MADTFIEKRKAGWRRLEELAARARGRRGLRRLSREEVREIGRSYRRAATDLAIARVESHDPRLVSYLNGLVIHAHGMIYRTPSRGLRAVFAFYRDEFPAVFRRTARFTVAVAAIFLLIALGSFVATYRDDDFADFAYVGRGTVQLIKENRMWTDWLNEHAPVGAAGIMANNLGVGFKTFAASILPVVGTVDALMPTALQFGAINALIVKYRMTLKLWSFVAGHGVLEFAAIFIAGGAGLMLGLSLVAPGERTRREALLERGATAIKLLAGCIPLLIIAGLIEGFVSPTPLHPAFKFSVSAATAVGLALYLRAPRA
ncbi:MAG TPA: stage II sporulation protein M [Blastocatellia bacterium]|nr:stage II sporulation protein M [Blastocatellia bacterium]